MRLPDNWERAGLTEAQGRLLLRISVCREDGYRLVSTDVLRVLPLVEAGLVRRDRRKPGVVLSTVAGLRVVHNARRHRRGGGG